CDVEFYCEHGAEVYSAGTCERRTPLGESCDQSPAHCVVGAMCVMGVCAVPAPGACGFARACDRGFRCGDDNVCHPGTLALGDTCGIVDGRFVDNDCGPGLVCGYSTCVPRPGLGETCIYSQCADGLFCHVSVESDALSVCEVPRAEGEACSNDNVVPIRCAD